VSQTAEEPAAATAPVKLDRVMLAMDVVDTLRHQQALVESELDDVRRQHEFVERVQAIYESQGIEVSASVIREGVRALREDRFVYSPPERTFGVRFAEIYVERGKWALRAVIMLVIGLVIWASFAVPMHFRRQGLMETYERNVATLEVVSLALADQAAGLEQYLERSRGMDNSAAMMRLLAEAEDALLDCTAQAESIDSARATLPDSEVYVEDQERWEMVMRSYSEITTEARAALDRGLGLLEAVEQLRSLQLRLDATRERLTGLDMSAGEQARIDAATKNVDVALAAGDGHAGEAALVALDRHIDAALAARQQQADTRAQFAAVSSVLEGVDVEPEAARQLQSLRATVEQAMVAGDWARAGRQVGALGTLVQSLKRTYELRIVSRRNDRSGVWRHPNNDRSKRNYYIIVEAIGADGKRLSLAIESEEDQSTRRVSRFGIRVPKSVYEQVKADKLDNGLIDDVVFGSKRRGAREPDYRFTVAGGRITRW